MMKSPLLMLGLCALLSACQTTKPQSVCDGWQRLTPTLETAVKITMDDRQFANQVASHNLFGRKKACWK